MSRTCSTFGRDEKCIYVCMILIGKRDGKR
jgi:hypothetical protein